MNDNPNELLTTEQAIEYLKERWGIASFTMNAFRQYRHRHKIKPSISLQKNASLWRRSDLDSLPPIDETKRRHRENSEQEKGLDSDTHAVLSFA
jgi:hypothetical protein